MKKYERIFVIVLDSLGIGAMPDSEKFGDVGVDTFGHILDKMGSLEIPNLKKLGMLNLHPAGNMQGVEKPIGRYMRVGEASNGKDTMTGHWEMMGIKTEKPFKTFTDTGFPPELIAELEKRCGKRVIGNKSASGTEIIEELGEEEIHTGAMIVYTSADSVLQICGNEETFDLQNLYRCCEIAREITRKDEWRVGRVIARPYVGKKKGEFRRTSNRHDYALKPTGLTALNALKDNGLDVIGVGKINDIFCGEGITKTYHSDSSVHGMEQTIQICKEDFRGLCFVKKAEAAVDQEAAQEMSKKLKKMDFDFNDYLTSLEQMNKMGGISSILNMLPGVGSKMKDVESMIDEKAMDRTKSIILSMTPQERSNPGILNLSRKNRIARGAGVEVAEVNRLVKQFEQSKKMMKQMPGLMGGGKMGGKRGGFKLPF